MISIQTQETKQSTTKGFEDVSFTIRKLSRIQRSLRDLPIFEQCLKKDDLTRQWWDLTKQMEVLMAADPKLAAINSQLSSVDSKSAEWDELATEKAALIKANPATAALHAQLVSVDYEFTLLLFSYLYPAAIRAGLVSITGVEINGQPATPELLATSATPELDELVGEIYAQCEVASGLSGAQRKNSVSPTTTQEPASREATPKTSTADTAS